MINKTAIPTEVQGWRLRETVDNYDRESIFSYINGAGEVYRAYHFINVDVYHYSKPGAPNITVEVFDMGSPEDAYGVFSYSREEEKDGIGQGYEQRGNLICTWQGRYYICVLADDKTDETEDVILTLAKKIAGAVTELGEKPELIKILPTDSLVSQRIRYFHTHPCLNFHYFLTSENILKLDLNSHAVLGEYQPGPYYLLVVKYNSEDTAIAAYNNFIEDYAPDAIQSGVIKTEPGKWLNVRLENEYILIVLDAPSKERAVSLLDNCKKKLSVL